MLIYALALDVEGLNESMLLAALAAAASAFPSLDLGTLAGCTSRDGGLVGGWVGHAPAVAAPRRLVSRSDDDVVTLVDGLPLARGWAAYDARVLGERWEEAAALDGLFSAARIDLAAGRAEVVHDALGLAPLFSCAWRGGHL